MAEEDIIAGLTGFDPMNHNPGRGNLYDFGNFKILVDYGHNIASYRCIFNLLVALTARRTVGIIGVPGDRRDEDIIEVGRLCGLNLDIIYVKEDADLRGRKPGEVADLLIRGINKSGSKAKVEVIRSEEKALETAVNQHQPGDVIVIFYEKLDPLQQILKKINRVEIEKQEFSAAKGNI